MRSEYTISLSYGIEGRLDQRDKERVTAQVKLPQEKSPPAAKGSSSQQLGFSHLPCNAGCLIEGLPGLIALTGFVLRLPEG